MQDAPPVAESLYQGVTEATPQISDGFAFRLTGFTSPPGPEYGIWFHPKLHAGDGAFMALGAQTSEPLRVHGSAVIIAPGVAITAKHVVDEICGVPGLTGVIGMVPRADGGITFWHATSYHPISNFDVVVMAIQPMTALEKLTDVYRPTLHARVPRVGERLKVMGFREGTPQTREEPCALSLFEAVGPVTFVHNRGRDLTMLPNPCVEVELDLLGGMSGGPAFDEAGRLIGIASTSYNSEDGRPAFISLIWPAIVWPFDPVWPPKLYPARTTLQALAAQEGQPADIVDAELVSLEGEPGGLVTFALATRLPLAE